MMSSSPERARRRGRSGGSVHERPIRSRTRSTHERRPLRATRWSCRGGRTGTGCSPERRRSSSRSDASRLGVQLALVRQPGDRRARARDASASVSPGSSRAPGAGRRAVADPAERGRVDRLGVRALAHLRQLLRIAEQQQVLRGDATAMVERARTGRPRRRRAGRGCRAGTRPALAKSHAVPPMTNRALVTPRTQVTVGRERGESMRRTSPRWRSRRAGSPAGAVRHLADPLGSSPAATTRSSRFSTTACDCATTPTFQPWSRDQAGDDLRAEVRLAGAGRALHGEIGAVEVEQARHDGVDPAVHPASPPTPSGAPTRWSAKLLRTACAAACAAAGRWRRRRGHVSWWRAISSVVPHSRMPPPAPRVRRRGRCQRDSAGACTAAPREEASRERRWSRPSSASITASPSRVARAPGCARGCAERPGVLVQQERPARR